MLIFAAIILLARESLQPNTLPGLIHPEHLCLSLRSSYQSTSNNNEHSLWVTHVSGELHWWLQIYNNNRVIDLRMGIPGYTDLAILADIIWFYIENGLHIDSITFWNMSFNPYSCHYKCHKDFKCLTYPSQFSIWIVA